VAALRRVAIVGLGPKGLYALERLISHAHRRSQVGPLEVHGFDPHPPGEGAAYDAAQPDYLRLNVSSRVVDGWYRDGRAPSAGRFPTLDEWRSQRDEPAEWGEFPPRALAGAYLRATWDVLTQRLPSSWTLTHHAERVERIDAVPEGWRIGGQDYAEVLVATGHAPGWAGALRHTWSGEGRLVPAVFPVSAMLSAAAVPAAAQVVVRGAALTFIDAALALSEGRGGRFAGRDGQLTYVPSGSEPERISPVARASRLMGAKMRSDVLAELRLDLPRRRGLSCARAAIGDVDEIRRALVETAAAYREAAGRRWQHRASHAVLLGEVDETLASLAAAPADGAEAELVRSVEIAHGEREPDATWALGQAWRDIYAGVVDALSYQTCSGEEWATFAALARDLERVAFGPPPGNAAKLLALVRAGVVDVGLLDAGASIDETGVWLDGVVQSCDVVIDAVLPPPGARDVLDPLLAQLLADGYARLGENRRGIVVLPDATCVGADGRPSPGLACVGRPTEDVVIGNDTLVRSLHDNRERWAVRVVEALTGDGHG